jgi:hypothetical protein
LESGGNINIAILFVIGENTLDAEIEITRYRERREQ